MVDSDHPRQNMWRKKPASVLHRNDCCACATYGGTPHNSLASPQGLATFHRGSGPIAAIIVGAIASSITLIVGQIAFTTLRSPLIRAVIALLFVVPAAVAGYHAALGLAHVGIPADGWRQAVAVAGAIIVAVTAWERMVLSAPRPTPDKALPPA
jgi:succinate dehydrogenase/fumarate reductase cytochrome b subunit